MVETRPSNGTITAVIIKPANPNHNLSPTSLPKISGNTTLPAPNSIANIARPTDIIFDVFIGFLIYLHTIDLRSIKIHTMVPLRAPYY